MKQKKKTTGVKKEDPNWKKLEKIVAEIQSEMAPEAEVRHNHYVVGKSGRRRQLDVTISQKIGAVPVFIVIECKRYNRMVGIGLVEQFAKKLEDVRASYGVMISNTGFDAGAKAVAAQENIMLRTFREAAETDWNRVFETAWVTLSDFDLKNRKVFIKLENIPVPIEASFGAILFMENGDDYLDVKPKRSTIDALFWDWWNERAERPRKIGPLRIEMLGITPSPYVEVQGGRLIKVENLAFVGLMTVKQYVMDMKLSEGKVLEDQETNNLEYVEVRTNDFSISRLRGAEGKEISPEDWEKVDRLEPGSSLEIEEGWDYSFGFTGGNR